MQSDDQKSGFRLMADSSSPTGASTARLIPVIVAVVVTGLLVFVACFMCLVSLWRRRLAERSKREGCEAGRPGHAHTHCRFLPRSPEGVDVAGDGR